MKEYLRCKPCGYVVSKDENFDVCPACGKDKKFFEPFNYKLVPLRKLILDMDIHPISVHFPQFFVSVIPIMIAFHWIFPTLYVNEISTIVGFMSFFFPFGVLGSIVTGFFDGQVRYKTVKTPAMYKKMIMGTLMLICSLVVFYYGPENIASLKAELIIFFSCLVGFVLAIFLGLLGKRLMFAYMPGGF